MDLKSVLPGESSLPTLSTSTAVASGMPAIPVDASTWWKFGGSAVMGLAGMMYLGYGKRTNDVQKMLIGAALTFGSILLF